ncbi:hypothetical protein GHT07_04220 [Caenimonas koreensis DSM 17982]|uniref:Phosphoribosyl transferase domain-containing protein n=1 Tax=Caenimonas koreensis DSM 17982 TaxID=1121255 RepID=A0A844AVQ9_9BURK|nr:hypothetical protein [Caenimonas koreensis]MRD46468.1 hypothetical protein [Caenimonas koreensis DSM 17982]
MRQRLQLIGGVERHQHFYLRPEHKCYFWGEYTPWEFTKGLTWNFSETNRLVADFKAPAFKQQDPDWQRKRDAIERISTAFAGFWKWSALAHQCMLVPVPPSRARPDPLFDDRMTQVLLKIGASTGVALDVREAIVSAGSAPTSHATKKRPKIDELIKTLSLSSVPVNPPKYIYLFDDVLTTGAHFVACSILLKKAFPDAAIVGNFVARCARPAPGSA